MDFIKSISMVTDRDDENRLCACFSFVVFCLFLTNLTGGLEALIGIPAGITSALLKLMILLRLVFCLDSILRRLDAKLICSVVFLVVFFLLNAVCFPENHRDFGETMLTFVVNCFPMFSLAYMISDPDCLRESLLRYSRIIAVVASVMFVFLITDILPSFNEDKYSMGYGYALLIPMLILGVNGLENKKWYDIVLCSMMFLSIFSLGSRGPLLVVAVFAVLYQAKKGWKQFLIVCIVIVLLVVCYDSVLAFFADLLDRWGLESRTLELLMRDEIYLSGRKDQYEFILDSLKKFPLAVNGINGEQIYIGGYAHNIFLELLYQFGVIGGGILCVAIVGMCSYELFFRKNTLTLLYMCVAVVHLMVSSSLWINITFWCWIGFMLKNSQENYKESENANEEESDCR